MSAELFSNDLQLKDAFEKILSNENFSEAISPPEPAKSSGYDYS